MHLVKEIKTSNILVKIYSTNPYLIVVDDPSLFESKNDQEIQEIVFNQIGAEQVDVYDNSYDRKPSNLRSYSLI